MMFTILFVYAFTLPNASKIISQKTMPDLHVNLIVSENDCNKCMRCPCESEAVAAVCF